MARLCLVVLACAGLAGSQPHVAARVDTGLSPGGAAATAKAVWVANDRAGTVTRIDPRTNRVTKRIRLRPGVFSVTSGFGSLWVVNYERGSLTRVDLGSGIRKTVRVGAVPFDVLAAYGRIWVTAWEAGRLVELDPSPLRIVRRIAIGARPTGLAASRGAIWVGFGRQAKAIAWVSPRTGRFERIPVGVRAPSWFVAGTGDLWIQAADHMLVHFDPSTRRVVRRVSFGRTLAQGAFGADGRLWMPDKEQNLVYRVDPATGRVVDSFAAGPGAFLVLRAFGSMWVTSYAGRDVWRFS
jgi:streptogramin lyase